MKRILIPLITSAALSLCLSSCFSSAGAKNTVVYTPSIAKPSPHTGAIAPWQIRVESPHSSEFLDSTRIAVRRKNNTLQVFEGARWSDTVPELLQRALTQHFNDSGKITAASALDSKAMTDAQLLLDIRQFEAVYDDNDQNAAAVISIEAKIQLQKSSRIIASKHFIVSVPASSKKIPAVMSAFDSALQQASQEILDWTLSVDVPIKNK
jgi:cholesterol transport system auxiliary component